MIIEIDACKEKLAVEKVRIQSLVLSLDEKTRLAKKTAELDAKLLVQKLAKPQSHAVRINAQQEIPDCS